MIDQELVDYLIKIIGRHAGADDVGGSCIAWAASRPATRIFSMISGGCTSSPV